MNDVLVQMEKHNYVVLLYEHVLNDLRHVFDDNDEHVNDLFDLSKKFVGTM